MTATLVPAGVLALRQAEAAGPFFRIEFSVTGRGWLALPDFVGSHDAMRRRMGVVRRALARTAGCVPGDVPTASAASIDLHGLAARLVSPALGACVVGGTAPMFTAERTWLRPGPQPLGVSGVGVLAVDSAAEAGRALLHGLVHPVLMRLVEAYRWEFGVSPSVLWGDVASAVNGAAEALERSGLAQRICASEVAANLLERGELRGTVRSFAPSFVRNSCCLYYRIPAGGICGDCILSA